MTDHKIRALFLDIGGVLLTNGWEHASRQLAAKKFGLDDEDMEERHQLIFDTYEMGKLTLDDYLNMVIFHQKRDFSKEDFKAFMFEQSQAFDRNIAFFKELKLRYRLKVIAVSNEGRELNEYRIKQFKLDELFDAYISSCYVHLHKPDKEMLKMASDISHTPPENALYVDDRPLLVDVAKSFGLQTLHFTGKEDAKVFIEKCSFQHQPVKDSGLANAGE
jgi:putative hydrolase of the HAD superfamily